MISEHTDQHLPEFIYKEELDCIELNGFTNPIAVTLSLLSSISGSHYSIPLNETLAFQSFETFLCNLDSEVIDDASFAHQEILCLPFVERDLLGRFHIHTLIDRPASLSDRRFERVLREAWISTPYSDDLTAYISDTDEHWLDSLMASQRENLSAELNCSRLQPLC